MPYRRRMIRADGVIDLRTLPVWAFWGLAALGIGLLVAVLFWMMPPPLRRGEGRRSVLVALGLLLVILARSSSRGTLWYAAVLCGVTALPLLWMGRLPADMPSARDPAIREHPRYPEFARRGRIVSVAIFALLALAVFLTMRYVRV